MSTMSTVRPLSPKLGGRGGMGGIKKPPWRFWQGHWFSRTLEVTNYNHCRSAFCDLSLHCVFIYFSHCVVHLPVCREDKCIYIQKQWLKPTVRQACFKRAFTHQPVICLFIMGNAVKIPKKIVVFVFFNTMIFFQTVELFPLQKQECSISCFVLIFT